jgi:hypothetical protein
MRFLQGLCIKLLVWDVEMYEIFARALHQAISMRCMRFLQGLCIKLLIWMLRCMRFLQGLCIKLLIWGVEVYEIFARALHQAFSMRCMGFLQELCTKLLVWVLRCMEFLQGLCTKLLVWGVEVYGIFARALHQAISMRCWGVWDFCKGSASSY